MALFRSRLAQIRWNRRGTPLACCWQCRVVREISWKTDRALRSVRVRKRLRCDASRPSSVEIRIGGCVRGADYRSLLARVCRVLNRSAIVARCWPFHRWTRGFVVARVSTTWASATHTRVARNCAFRSSNRSITAFEFRGHYRRCQCCTTRAVPLSSYRVTNRTLWTRVLENEIITRYRSRVTHKVNNLQIRIPVNSPRCRPHKITRVRVTALHLTTLRRTRAQLTLLPPRNRLSRIARARNHYRTR